MSVEKMPGDSVGNMQENKTEQSLQLEKRLKEIDNEIVAAQGRLDAVAQKKPKLAQKIQSQIDGLKREKLKVDFEKDLLSAEDINSIDDITNKQVIIQKVGSKNGKVAVFDLGQKFNGEIIIGKCEINGIFAAQVPDGRIFKIPMVRGIKLCADGTYLIESNNSWYRLTLEESAKEERKDQGEEYKFQEAVEGLSSGDKIISRSGTVREVKEVVGDEIRTVNFTANRYNILSIEEDFRNRNSEWVAEIRKAEK